MKKIRITTLGCKVNQFESASFQYGLEQAGCMPARLDEAADAVIINTCAVTARAGAQSRQAVRQALRQSPGARIIITGCYAEIAAATLLDLPELAGRSFSIIGNSEKHLVVEASLQTGRPIAQQCLGDITAASQICRLPVRRFPDKTRAFLRVQDGCDSFCTYCIVPFSRGRSRSLPIDEVVQQAITFAREGHREIVLTGIHLGCYGRDLAETADIGLLLDRLSAALPTTRFRISSLEPIEIKEEILALMGERKNLMPHLHIPLQSGDDEILKWMNRRYTTEQFAEIIDLCRQYLPNAAIGIDIMAGFPGETEEHYSRTRSFLETLDCTYLHVFPYSERPGTKAATFPGKVAKTIRNRRVAELLSLGERKKIAFYTRQMGRILPVLVETQRNSDDLLRGFTDNYVPVSFSGPDSLMGSIASVKLKEQHNTVIRGEVTDER